MEEDIKKSGNGEGSGARIQDSDEQKFRYEPTGNGETYRRVPIGNDEPSLESDAIKQAREEERRTRASIETGNSYHRRFTGRDARDDESAQVFASFDPRNTEPQLAEFWKYRDSEIDDSGYF